MAQRKTGKKTSVENSPFREYIESELRKGTPYRDLSLALKERGEAISYTALHNYHRNKMNGEHEPPPVEQVEVEPEPEIEFNPEADVIDTLNEAYKMQAQIFAAKQKEYATSGQRFPKADLQALKDLQALIKTHHGESLNEKLGRIVKTPGQIRSQFLAIAKQVREPYEVVKMLRAVDVEREPLANLKKVIELNGAGKLEKVYTLPERSFSIALSDFDTLAGKTIDEILKPTRGERKAQIEELKNEAQAVGLSEAFIEFCLNVWGISDRKGYYEFLGAVERIYSLIGDYEGGIINESDSLAEYLPAYVTLSNWKEALIENAS
jgi:hypothetical protein